MQTNEHEATEIVGTLEDAPPQPGRAIAASSSPSDLLAMAVSNGANIETLERLMALKERHEANEARKAYVDAMASFKAEPIDLRKSKGVGYNTNTGDFVGYKHATVADVVDAVVPMMAKHGLSHAWDVQQVDGQIKVTCTITHALGHSESVSMQAAPDDSGKKNPIQQIASTVTYLQRYTLMSATGVAAKDMDDDGQGSTGPKPLDEKAEGWLTKIGQISTPDQYTTARRELITDYKTSSKVPPKLMAELNKARDAVMPRD